VRRIEIDAINNLDFTYLLYFDLIYMYT